MGLPAGMGESSTIDVDNSNNNQKDKGHRYSSCDGSLSTSTSSTCSTSTSSNGSEEYSTSCERSDGDDGEAGSKSQCDLTRCNWADRTTSKGAHDVINSLASKEAELPMEKNEITPQFSLSQDHGSILSATAASSNSGTLFHSKNKYDTGDAYQECRCVSSFVTLYIQMQLCEYALNDWLLKRSTAPSVLYAEAIHIFHQVVSGVQYIHSMKLIHRDIKVNEAAYAYVEMCAIVVGENKGYKFGMGRGGSGYFILHIHVFFELYFNKSTVRQFYFL